MRKVRLSFLVGALVFTLGALWFQRHYDIELSTKKVASFTKSQTYRHDKIFLKCRAESNDDLFTYGLTLHRVNESNERKNDLSSIQVLDCQVRDLANEEIHDASGWFNHYFTFAGTRNVTKVDETPVDAYFSRSFATYGTWSPYLEGTEALEFIISVEVTFSDGTKERINAKFRFDVTHAKKTTVTLVRPIKIPAQPVD